MKPATRAILLVGIAYCAAGVIFGALSGQAATHQMVVAWRLAAWIVSAIVFGAHIVYEQVWLRSAPRTTALHVSSASAIGAFGLAAAANIHSLTSVPDGPSRSLVSSLAIWPIIMMIPAFLVALVAAAILARVRRND